MDAKTEKEIERLKKKLRDTVKKITTNHSADPGLMETDVAYCGLMEMCFILRWQIAELNENSLVAINYSKQATEWSRRKVAAVTAQKADLLPKVLEALRRQDALASQLEGLE